MLVGFLFLIARLTELFFLIPIIGMLSYFVSNYVAANELTPTLVLVLFIVSVLAGVWALMTLIFYGSAKHNGYLIAFVDLCIWGGLIAGVYELRNIGSASCTSRPIHNQVYISVGLFVNPWTSTCNMLKASFALGIMEIFFFFWTFLLALWIHHHHRKDDYERRSRVERHSSRHSQRQGGTSGSRSRAGGGGGGGGNRDYGGNYGSNYGGNRSYGGNRGDYYEDRTVTRSQYDSRRSYV